MRRIVGMVALAALIFGLPSAEASGKRRKRPSGDTETVSTVAGPVSIRTSAGTFTRVGVVDEPATAPASFDYPVGFFGLEISKIKKRQAVTVSFDLPDAVVPQSVVKCGPSGCAEFPAQVAGSSFTVRLTDGGSGDTDGKADGRITDPIAPAVPGCELAEGEHVVAEWSGEIGPDVVGINGTEDTHAFDLPEKCTIESLDVRIEWASFTDDIDLDVTTPDGETTSAQETNAVTLDPSETISFDGPEVGAYTARAYGFVTTGTSYTGTATVSITGEPANETDDADSDGAVDGDDNCPSVFNPSQTDSDADGTGDVCDEPSPPLPPDARAQVFSASGESGVSAFVPPIGVTTFQDTGITTSDDHQHHFAVPLSNHYTDYSQLEVRIDWELEFKDYFTLEVRDPAGRILTGIFVNSNYQEAFFDAPVPGEYLVTVRESRTTTGPFTVSAFATRATATEAPLGEVPPIASDPARPRVVVADLDSAINPYHSFYYGGSEIYPDSHPSSVTQEVLNDLGVKPENVVTLTRTGNIAADIAADGPFWNRVQRGELYHFRGTNIVATSYAPPDEIPLKPGRQFADPADETLKSPHGVGTSGAVLRANPDAVLLFVEQGGELGSERSHRFAFLQDAVDMVTTSYGFGVPEVGFPLPEAWAFEHTHEGVVGKGKMHFSSGGNGPGLTPARAGAGPWWSIGVSGIEEGTSEGDSLLSGNFPDFVSDFTQDLPYCVDCEAGYQNVGGTSFSTPRAAGVASRVLLDARRTLGHAGGITTVDGEPVMAAGGETVISNWLLRRALEQAAWTPDSAAYDPVEGVFDLVGLPINPLAPWLQTGWGDLTADAAKGVVPAALAQLGFGGEQREKGTGYCEFQTAIIEERKLYWDSVASMVPPLLGEQPPGAPAEDPFVYC